MLRMFLLLLLTIGIIIKNAVKESVRCHHNPPPLQIPPVVEKAITQQKKMYEKF